jgi:hypothetical protein
MHIGGEVEIFETQEACMMAAGLEDIELWVERILSSAREMQQV